MDLPCCVFPTAPCQPLVLGRLHLHSSQARLQNRLGVARSESSMKCRNACLLDAAVRLLWAKHMFGRCEHVSRNYPNSFMSVLEPKTGSSGLAEVATVACKHVYERLTPANPRPRSSHFRKRRGRRLMGRLTVDHPACVAHM